MVKLWAGFTAMALVMTAQSASALVGSPFGSLASPEAFLVEHAFMMAIGTWGLVQLIKQGKSQATRDDLGKLRDDNTAVLLEYQTRMDARVDHLTARLDDLWERRSKTR